MNRKRSEISVDERLVIRDTNLPSNFLSTRFLLIFSAREEKQSIVGLLKRGRLPRSLINQAIDRLLDQRRLHVA